MTDYDDQKRYLLKAARRLQAIEAAKDSLIEYTRLCHPHPDDPDDVTKSLYEVTPQARMLCEIIEKLDRRELKLPNGRPCQRVAVSVGPQMGKALEEHTPIPTPSGWKAIGELAPGDEVFADDGSVCRVVATQWFADREVYEVTADDGFSVVADAEHEWPVRLSRDHPVVKVKTTRYLADRKAERNPLLRMGGALQTPEAELPVDPYVLGVWLGDGCSESAYVTAVGDDGEFIERQVQAAGYRTRRHSDPKNFGILGLQKLLRLAGLINNKHVPAPYLRASPAQRKALLQGLIDTDGYVSPEGAVEFCTTRWGLAEGCRELVVSLGVKCQVYEKRATLYGKDCGPKWCVCFFMEDAARLPRKRERCRFVSRCAGRYLTVTPVGRANTVCIQVDCPSCLFLCGKGMLVTHNSELISRKGPAWVSGRNPRANMILGSYNQDMANGFGDDVRSAVVSGAHRQVFPNYSLRKGGAAKDMLITEDGGKLAFVGVGGSGTGKPADGFVVDDPIKNDDEAASEVYRNRVWNWFTKVANTRIHKRSWILVTHTRWSEDDLIGRACDPDHPERYKAYDGVADEWIYINLPAVVTDERLAKALGLTLRRPVEFIDDIQDLDLVLKQFGDKPMAALWEDRFDLPFLARQKRLDKRGFTALRMGKPTPDDGDYFTQDMIVEYHSEAELPKRLRKYGASDHALSEAQRADYTVIGAVGVDEVDDIWILPDLVMDRMETPEIVETLLEFFKRHRPLIWWMENETVSKSFGPFLFKRMNEKRIYTSIDPMTPSKEKKVRARAIQGRMGMRKVHFPAFAPWWPEAKAQLLKFPYGTHDDFVDFLAHIGAGLLKEFPAAKEEHTKPDNVVTVGSLAWILAESRRRARNEERKKANAGW